jgi:hypothetical protein
VGLQRKTPSEMAYVQFVIFSPLSTDQKVFQNWQVESCEDIYSNVSRGKMSYSLRIYRIIKLRGIYTVDANSVPYIRGLQCFKLNENQTENDRYWQKNNFLLFAKCLKMDSFFRICI